MKRLFAALALTLAASVAAFAGPAPQTQSAEGDAQDPKGTSAYAALVLRKVAVSAELADLSSRLTNESREVRARQVELSLLRREMEAMQAVGRDGVARLSNAYGQLVLRKVALEVELYGLRDSYTAAHPDVKKKRVELQLLRREIEDILK